MLQQSKECWIRSGISSTIPRLSNIEAEKLAANLVKIYGIVDAKDLTFITEDDLLKSGFLKIVDARKLIQKWEKG